DRAVVTDTRMIQRTDGVMLLHELLPEAHLHRQVPDQVERNVSFRPHFFCCAFKNAARTRAVRSSASRSLRARPCMAGCCMTASRERIALSLVPPYQFAKDFSKPICKSMSRTSGPSMSLRSG